MANTKNLLALAALAAGFILPAAAQAQSQSFPPLELEVTPSRLGAGVTGAATTIITEEDIQRSPALTLPDILQRQTGIQVQKQFSSVAGALDTVDMRGFGATGTANTLILVNGRRLNDVDLAGVDFSAIPKDSIRRIEITRGNAGGVLYGDGAVGGVINIVTKPATGRTAYGVEAALGSHRYAEASVRASDSVGPVSLRAFGNTIESEGYRVNNELRQKSAVAEGRYRTGWGETYLTLSGDRQFVGLPGVRRRTNAMNQLDTDREGASTPNDYAKKQGANLTLGGTGMLRENIELTIDGGVRHKEQQAGIIDPTDPAFDAYVDTKLTTLSLTPRANVKHSLMGRPARAIVGLDVYDSDYDSNRGVNPRNQPNHVFNLNQQTYGFYAQDTVGLRPETDISLGLRLDHQNFDASDRVNAAAPGGNNQTQGRPFNDSDTQYSAHLGAEHRINPSLRLFGRLGRSVRLPTVDERAGTTAFGVPPDFRLDTQTSWDVEAGVGTKLGPVALEARAFRMELEDEIAFNPVNFTNINLDDTRRTGVELEGNWAVLPSLRLRGGVTYTDAEFRAGTNAGKEVPLVSTWTGLAGVSWDIRPRTLVFDIDLRYVGERRFDNDQRNRQQQIPASGIVDLKIGGQVDDIARGARWSLGVQNALDRDYFIYGVASATTLGTFSAYPLSGRTVMARVGVDF